jgi:dTDP-4-amino-4,6-dideoxygalactose transaminase
MIEYENLGKANASFLAEIEQRTSEIMRGGWFILGPEVEKFEKSFASYCDSPHCVGVASGLDALLLALKALDLPPGSEVIVPSNTYIATILAVLQAGHKPVLVEPSIETYNIDPQKIEAAITAKTKAVMIVHLYGKACQMDKITGLCARHNLALIEDCAQSHGARFKGQITGSFGIGAFSFYPTKNLGAFGDAGAVTCQNAEIENRLRHLRNYGSKQKYYNEMLGYNSRLDELQAGVLNVKLKYLDKINEHKRALAQVYFESLGSSVILPSRQKENFDVFHIFNIRSNRRDELREHLLQNGIKTEIHYPIAPVEQKAMKGILLDSNFPIAEEIHRTTLSLPISYFHTVDDIEQVAKAINDFF